MRKKIFYTDEEFEKNFEYIKTKLQIESEINGSDDYYSPATLYHNLYLYTVKQQKTLVNWIYEKNDKDDYQILTRKLTIVENMIGDELGITTKKLFYKLLVENQERIVDQSTLWRSWFAFGTKYTPKNMRMCKRDSYRVREKYRKKFDYNTEHEKFIRPYLEQVKFDPSVLSEIIKSLFEDATHQYKGYDNAFIVNDYLYYLEANFSLDLSEYALKDKLEDGTIYE